MTTTRTLSPLDQDRAIVAELDADLADLEKRAADLKTERAQLEGNLTQARAVIEAASAEAQRLEREPADHERLVGLIATLRARLAEAPRNSPTAATVKARLESLTHENTPVADRLTLCRRLLDDLKNAYVTDRQVWDATEAANAARMRRPEK